MYHINNEDKVPYITFPSFEKLGVKHGFSTKKGGVSKGTCESMNLSFHRGDNPEDVMMNHHLLADAIGYDDQNLVFSDQVHKTVIRTVGVADRGKGITKLTDIEEVDGLITNEKDVVLMTFYADCVPLFFADPVNQVVAMAHSGWRGTVAQIGKCMVERMETEFGCAKKNIHVVIGPSICQDCYEVSGDVAKEFQKTFPAFAEGILEEKAEDKYQLDLWNCNQCILLEAGLPQENVEVSGLCTCCHPDLLFSHRFTKGKRGNLAGVIWL